MIGWREWVSLPELGINLIKTKIDTGAKTSVIHAFEIESFHEHGKDQVRFSIHPKQGSTHKSVRCVAELVDLRWVSDSSGHREHRYVIKTLLKAGDYAWPVEMTLSRRDNMRYRMLLGRTALRDRFIIDLSHSYLLGK